MASWIDVTDKKHGGIEKIKEKYCDMKIVDVTAPCTKCGGSSFFQSIHSTPNQYGRIESMIVCDLCKKAIMKLNSSKNALLLFRP
jgi:hypothetical protein